MSEDDKKVIQLRLVNKTEDEDERNREDAKRRAIAFINQLVENDSEFLLIGASDEEGIVVVTSMDVMEANYILDVTKVNFVTNPF